MAQDPQSTSHTSAWQLGPDPGWPAELDQVKQCNTLQLLRCMGAVYRSVMLLYSTRRVKSDMHVPSNDIDRSMTGQGLPGRISISDPCQAPQCFAAELRRRSDVHAGLALIPACSSNAVTDEVSRSVAVCDVDRAVICGRGNS